MTLDEFEALYPERGRELRAYVHADQFVIDVGQEGDRWVALVQLGPSAGWETERLLEARCRPGCVDRSDRPRAWTWEGHECCRACEADPGHRYRDIHE